MTKGSTTRPGWNESVSAWSAVLSQARSAATNETYVRHVWWLAHEAEGLEPWSVTSGTLETALRRQNWSRHTRAKVLVSLRAFFAWAMDEGYCSRSPLAGVAVDHNKPGPKPVSPRAAAWAHAISDHLVWLRAGGRSPGTIGVRRSHLMRLSELYADPWQVTTDDLALWLARPDLAAETRRAMRSAVVSFYRWAVLVERTGRNPAEVLDRVRLPRALPRPITRDALSQALSDADDRQRLILLLGAVAGLRRAEIAAVHMRDVIGDHLRVRGKGGNDRLIPLHPDLAAALRHERTRRIEGRPATGWSGPYVHHDGYLFPSSLTPSPLTAKHVGVIAAECLPTGWTLHTLRHRFASHAYAAQRDLRAVQELLGHTKPETTARYAAVPDGARLMAVMGAGI